jgi:hypothetical protein
VVGVRLKRKIRKMKINFIYNLLPPFAATCNDGLRAAMRIVEKEYEVKYVNVANGQEAKVNVGDLLLVWGSLGAKWVDDTGKVPVKKILLFGGGRLDKQSAYLYDYILAESKCDVEDFKSLGHDASQAFGVNTELFKPMNQVKMFDAIYPAAFADWKHQELFASICKDRGYKGLAFGYIQKDNLEESMKLINECLVEGVAVSDWIPYDAMPYFYNMAHRVIVCPDLYGGCQRTVLEAKACGIEVEIVGKDNKLIEFKDLTPDEVREKWSEKVYSSQLLDAIKKAWK